MTTIRRSLYRGQSGEHFSAPAADRLLLPITPGTGNSSTPVTFDLEPAESRLLQYGRVVTDCSRRHNTRWSRIDSARKCRSNNKSNCPRETEACSVTLDAISLRLLYSRQIELAAGEGVCHWRGRSHWPSQRVRRFVSRLEINGAFNAILVIVSHKPHVGAQLTLGARHFCLKMYV